MFNTGKHAGKNLEWIDKLVLTIGQNDDGGHTSPPKHQTQLQLGHKSTKS